MTEAREKPTRPIVGVGAIVIRDNHVLLIRRGKPPKAGEWSLPGGRQKLGETTAEAAMREVKEETGLDVTLHGILDVVDFMEDDKKGGLRFHYTLVDYLATAPWGTPMAATDAIDARFFPLEEALKLPLWTETLRLIRMGADKITEFRKDPPS